jgi:peptide/nickel transport system substrate-binding protein
VFINQGIPSAPRSAADVDVRRAIAFATDVDLIDERVNRGTGLPTSALVHPESLLADGALGPSYDPYRASSLVEEARLAGWSGRLGLLCFDDPVSVERCLTLEGLLEAAGMEIMVENVPVNVLVQRVVVDRDYDLACLGFAFDAEPWTALAQYESESPFSRTGYGNAAFDAALDRLRASETVEETRLALAEAQGVWNETIPSVVLAASDDFVALSDNMHGVRMTRDSVVMFDDAYIDG